MSLARRSISSITWISLVGIFIYPIGLIQSIILARFLPIETFGVFVGVSSITNLSYIFFDFGLTKAFIHRSEETKDEEWAAKNFFTLRLILDTTWAIILILYGLLFMYGTRQLALFILVISGYLTKIAVTPRAILTRRVQHRRLALIDMVVSLTSAIISMVIAWLDQSIWALLTSSIVTLVCTITGLYFIRPVWRPRLAWCKSTTQYFFSFGGKNLVNSVLDSTIDNIDNLWTSYFIGDRQLGFYSRAYKFASYPRMILVLPINAVLMGTFAELKYDRERLSKTFFRISVFLTRTGFLLAGGLAMIAPEFIQIFLGDKWLPMLNTFRLMLIFALLDPLRLTIASVFTAVGEPGKTSMIRLTQLVILLIGLFTLGLNYKAAGVAIAIDAMAVVGVFLSIFFVRRYVDFSIRRLLAPPVMALSIGLLLTWFFLSVWEIPNKWLSLLSKGSVFSILYFGVLYLIEGRILWSSFLEIIDRYTNLKWMKSE